MAEYDDLNPMETAPKDGTPILVKFKYEGWIQCKYNDVFNHWMPIVLSYHGCNCCCNCCCANSFLDESLDIPLGWTNLPYEAKEDTQC